MMHFYLRFLCYTDPSRQSFAPIHADIPLGELRHFVYGESVQIGPDETDPLFWPSYRVGKVTQMDSIDDRNKSGHQAVLITVFVVREEEWHYFDLPTPVRWLLNFTLQTDWRDLCLN